MIKNLEIIGNKYTVEFTSEAKEIIDLVGLDKVITYGINWAKYMPKITTIADVEDLVD